MCHLLDDRVGGDKVEKNEFRKHFMTAILRNGVGANQIFYR